MTKYIITLLESAGYFGIVLLMFAENIFPPIPSEFIMPLTGFMVSQGKFTFVGVVLAGTIGSVLGTLPFYYLGKKVSEERLTELAEKYGHWLTISPEDLQGSLHWFDRHGKKTILLCRLIPGVRSVISIPAGINKMSLAPFLAYTTIGTALWTTLLTLIGYLLKSNFARVEEYLDPVSYVVFGGLFLLYLYRIIRARFKAKAD